MIGSIKNSIINYFSSVSYSPIASKFNAHLLSELNSFDGGCGSIFDSKSVQLKTKIEVKNPESTCFLAGTDSVIQKREGDFYLSKKRSLLVPPALLFCLSALSIGKATFFSSAFQRHFSSQISNLEVDLDRLSDLSTEVKSFESSAWMSRKLSLLSTPPVVFLCSGALSIAKSAFFSSAFQRHFPSQISNLEVDFDRLSDLSVEASPNIVEVKESTQKSEGESSLKEVEPKESKDSDPSYLYKVRCSEPDLKDPLLGCWENKSGVTLFVEKREGVYYMHSADYPSKADYGDCVTCASLFFKEAGSKDSGIVHDARGLPISKLATHSVSGTLHSYRGTTLNPDAKKDENGLPVLNKKGEYEKTSSGGYWDTQLDIDELSPDVCTLNTSLTVVFGKAVFAPHSQGGAVFHRSKRVAPVYHSHLQKELWQFFQINKSFAK